MTDETLPDWVTTSKRLGIDLHSNGLDEAPAFSGDKVVNSEVGFSIGTTATDPLIHMPDPFPNPTPTPSPTPTIAVTIWSPRDLGPDA